MRLNARMLALPLAIAAGAALASPPPSFHPHSPDLQNRAHTRLSHLLRQANPRAPAVSDADVGDADSFGRTVVYAGLLGDADVDLEPDCSSQGSPADCVTLNPQPAVTRFDREDVVHITLPGNTTHSFLCFQTSTYRDWGYMNHSSTPADAEFRYQESVTLESDLLKDPSLIDPSTGLPFNGKIRSYVGTDLFDSRTLEGGFQESHGEWSSRTCQAGLISKSYLETVYDLPPSVVNQFFKQPITLRLNLEGGAALVDYGYIITGIRLYGD